MFMHIVEINLNIWLVKKGGICKHILTLWVPILKFEASIWRGYQWGSFEIELFSSVWKLNIIICANLHIKVMLLSYLSIVFTI